MMILFIFMMLLPVVAGAAMDDTNKQILQWAVECPSYSTCAFDESGNVVVLYNQRLQSELSCLAKMREAMKAAQHGRVEHGTKGLEDWIVLKMYKEDRARWDQTYQDCVEGR